MKRKILGIFIFIIFSTDVSAQVGQFAVVRPDGTTYICPTWDSVYNKAQDGDKVYLPGVTINGNLIINKALEIYGAGHHPDSTTITNKSQFIGSLTIKRRVYLEGIEISSIILSDTNANNSSFVNIFASSINCLGTSGHYIAKCIVNSLNYFAPCTTADNIFVCNSILNTLYNLSNSVIQNCIFTGGNATNIYTITTSNTLFKNNIFHGNFANQWPNYQTNCFPIVGNFCYNNIFTSASVNLSPNGIGNYSNVNGDNIFVTNGWGSFSYTQNYHLKNDSPYLTAGTDGTQIGLYGGLTPASEGWVPSNPHIYFKQVNTITNSNGQLPVQFKVRTGN